MAHKGNNQSKPALGMVAGIMLTVLNLGGIAYNLYQMGSGPDRVRLPLFIVHGLGVFFGVSLTVIARRRRAAFAVEALRDAGQPPRPTDG